MIYILLVGSLGLNAALGYAYFKNASTKTSIVAAVASAEAEVASLSKEAYVAAGHLVLKLTTAIKSKL
jgi:hypothetical protein